MAYLVLIRHTESVWNEKGLWTGWTDVDLDPKGIDEARKTAGFLRDMHFDQAFSSDLIRAQETLTEIKNTLHMDDLPIIIAPELKEKNYGDYAGKNKWDVEKEVGEEEFQKIRRSWDYALPHGESLKDVYHRVVPYYNRHILPLLEEGKNVLVVFHGNSMRALVKYLDHVSDEEIPHVEIATGEIYVYTIDRDGNVIHKEKRASRKNTV